MPSGESVAKPPLLGFAAAADLWLFGAIFMFAPSYIGFEGLLKWGLIGAGFIFVGLSLAGAMTELSKLLKNEALNYFGVGLLFLLPAVGLFTAGHLLSPTEPWMALIKIGALFLIAIGGGLVFHGVPYLLWKERRVLDATDSEVSRDALYSSRRRASREVGASIIVAILSLATAIIGFVAELSK